MIAVILMKDYQFRFPMDVADPPLALAESLLNKYPAQLGEILFTNPYSLHNNFPLLFIVYIN